MVGNKTLAEGQKASGFEEIGLEVELMVANLVEELVGQEHLGERKKDVMVEG